MVKGITSEGFEFEIDERRVKDWRVQSAVVDLAKNPDSKDAKLDLFQGMRFVVGVELERALVDCLTEKYGYADRDVVAQEIGEIYHMANEALEANVKKNSNSSSAVSQPMRMPSSVTSQKPMECSTINHSPSSSPQPYVQDYGETAELRQN